MGLFQTRTYQYDTSLLYLPSPWFPTLQDAYTIILSRELTARRGSQRSTSTFPLVEEELLLEPAQLRRYADAIVKASLGVRKDDTLVVAAEPAHRELALAVVESGYRAGTLMIGGADFEATGITAKGKRIPVIADGLWQI